MNPTGKKPMEIVTTDCLMAARKAIGILCEEFKGAKVVFFCVGILPRAQS
jgi:hypothetical protein